MVLPRKIKKNMSYVFLKMYIIYTDLNIGLWETWVPAVRMTDSKRVSIYSNIQQFVFSTVTKYE